MRLFQTGSVVGPLAAAVLTAALLVACDEADPAGEVEDLSYMLPQLAGWLEQGEVGPLGSFDPGLEPDRVEQVGCARAQQLIDLRGERPELRGCEDALVVSGRGLSGMGTERTTTGRIAAIVILADHPDAVEPLQSSLVWATLTEELALDGEHPTTAIPSTTARSVIVANNDNGEIPHAEEGAHLFPLMRSLAWLLNSSHQGLVVVPDPYEE